MNRLLKLSNRATTQNQSICGALLKNNVVVTRAASLKSKAASSEKVLESRGDTRDEPVKFSTSKAYVDYKASLNFYGDPRDLPPSHNIVIATSFILSFIYLIYLRDEKDDGGGSAFIQPLHETLPNMAIPLLKSAINENRKFGNDTKKLEQKLAEYMKEPKRHGGQD